MLTKLVDGKKIPLSQDEILELESLNAEIEAGKPAREAKKVRQKRDALLSETDWIVIMHTERGTNIPMEWEMYRQALRDITAQEGFPFNVTWPEMPGS